MKLAGINVEVRKEPLFPAKKHSSTQKNSSVIHDLPNFAYAHILDAVQIPREIWMTFTFTLVVGTFLFGGGIYLVYNGTVNNVTDFVVLGSCGSLVGLCFSSVGSVILLKSVCRSRKDRCFTQAKHETNGLLISYFPDGQTRIVTLQKTDQVASLRQENSNNAEVSGSRTTAKVKKFRISTKDNVYDNFPSTTAASPVRDSDATAQPLVQLNHVNLPINSNVSRSIEKDEDRVVVNHVETQKVAVNNLPSCASDTSLQIQSTIANVSPPCILNKRCVDSWKSYQESLTVVVAEVHAEPGSYRSSLRNPTSFHSRQQDIHESLLATSPIPSDDDDDEDAMYSLDFITGDNASRPDTGVGESISEEDFPFVNDEPSFSYRMLTSDAENSDDEIMATAMDDPLIFNRGNGGEHSCIFNKCHVITEVLVHSG